MKPLLHMELPWRVTHMNEGGKSTRATIVLGNYIHFNIHNRIIVAVSHRFQGALQNR